MLLFESEVVGKELPYAKRPEECAHRTQAYNSLTWANSIPYIGLVERGCFKSMKKGEWGCKCKINWSLGPLRPSYLVGRSRRGLGSSQDYKTEGHGVRTAGRGRNLGQDRCIPQAKKSRSDHSWRWVSQGYQIIKYVANGSVSLASDFMEHDCTYLLLGFSQGKGRKHPGFNNCLLGCFEKMQ